MQAESKEYLRNRIQDDCFIVITGIVTLVFAFFGRYGTERIESPLFREIFSLVTLAAGFGGAVVFLTSLWFTLQDLFLLHVVLPLTSRRKRRKTEKEVEKEYNKMFNR